MTKRYSHEDLRSWGASLDREQPQGLGQVLMRYADFWQAEVDDAEASNQGFVEDEGERMTTNFQQYETQRKILIDYLFVMIARCDWHGVADVAMDLRELEAEQRGRHEPKTNH